MSSFPLARITASRLDLREFAPGDEGLIQELQAAGEAGALPPGAPAQADGILEWLSDGVHRPRQAGEGLYLMMYCRTRAVLVGFISFFSVDWEVRSAEVGYRVRSDQRGCGYATEALAAATSWGLSEGGLQRIMLVINTDNLASLRVAEKAGFSREGTMRRAGVQDDGLHDLALFARLDGD